MVLYCDVDSEGNIVNSLQGVNLVEVRQYDYTFELEEEIDVTEYLVVDGQLTKKAVE